MKLCKGIGYDVKEYVLKNRRLILIPVLFWAYCCYIRIQVFNMDSTIQGTFLDYIFYSLKGCDPLLKSTDVDFPIFWLAGMFLSLFITTGFVQKDMSGFGLQVMVRENSRKQWWVSKCVTSVLLSFLYVVIAVLTIFLFCLINNVDISLQGTEAVIEQVLKSDWFEARMDIQLGSIESIVALAILPFLVIAALNALQQLLSLLIDPVISFVIVNCYSLLAVYTEVPISLAGYAMLNHNNCYVYDGLETVVGVIICLIVIVFSAFLGYFVFRKKDVI